MQPSVSQILEFLQMLKNSDIGYSGLNSTRSSPSLFLTIEGYEAGKHSLVCKFVVTKICTYLGCRKSHTLPWE